MKKINTRIALVLLLTLAWFPRSVKKHLRLFKSLLRTPQKKDMFPTVLHSAGVNSTMGHILNAYILDSKNSKTDY